MECYKYNMCYSHYLNEFAGRKGKATGLLSSVYGVLSHRTKRSARGERMLMGTSPQAAPPEVLSAPWLLASVCGAVHSPKSFSKSTEMPAALLLQLGFESCKDRDRERAEAEYGFINKQEKRVPMWMDFLSQSGNSCPRLVINEPGVFWKMSRTEAVQSN